MKEQANLSDPTNSGLQHDSVPDNDSVELIESEMDALRQRMKRLEKRLQHLTGNSVPVPLSATSHTRNPAPGDTQSNIILTPASSSQQTNTSSHRRPLKKPSGQKSRRTSRKPRKTRSSKVKRNLLLGYGLLIGVGVVSVFVLMVMNLFNADIYLPSTAPPATVEMEIDAAPDLEELRMSIQDAEE